MLRKPFGFAKYSSETAGKPMLDMEANDEIPQKMVDLANMMSKVDYVSHDIDAAISQAMLGGNPVPWNVFAFVMSYVLV